MGNAAETSESAGEIGFFVEGKQASFKTQQVGKFLCVSDTSVKNLEKQYKLSVPREFSGAVKQRLFDLDHLFELGIKKAWRGDPQKTDSLSCVMVWNRKGGVGKTTVSRELACIWQLRGKRVLFVDIDPQNNATTACGYSVDFTEDNFEEYGIPERHVIKHHFADLLDLFPFNRNQKIDKESLIKKPFGEYGPHLICAKESLDQLQSAIERESFGIKSIQTMILKSLQGSNPNLDLRDYDIVLFDCNPMYNKVIDALYCACDTLIIPVVMDAFSQSGVEQALDVLTYLSEKGVERLPTPYVLGNKYNRNYARCRKNYEELIETYGDKRVLQTTVSMREEVTKWQTECTHIPHIFRYPNDSTTQEFMALADEILGKMKQEK